MSYYRGYYGHRHYWGLFGFLKALGVTLLAIAFVVLFVVNTPLVVGLIFFGLLFKLAHKLAHHSGRNIRQPILYNDRQWTIRRGRTMFGRYRCTYCRRKTNSAFIGPDGRRWQVDHKKAVSRGGKNKRSNYCLSCATCNEQKSNHRHRVFGVWVG